MRCPPLKNEAFTLRPRFQAGITCSPVLAVLPWTNLANLNMAMLCNGRLITDTMSRVMAIGEEHRTEHKYLTGEDECFYLLEYDPYRFDGVKELLKNLKLTVALKGTTEWNRKQKAIEATAGLLSTAIPAFQHFTTLVPVPPSKKKDDPLYDDRLVSVLKQFCGLRRDCDVRELIVGRDNYTPFHESSTRLTPGELLPLLRMNELPDGDNAGHLMLLDDVISTGCHFKACKTLLTTTFPHATVSGLFIARRIIC